MKQAPVIAMGSGKSLHRGINVHHYVLVVIRTAT